MIGSFVTRWVLPLAAVGLLVFAIWHVMGMTQTNLASAPASLAEPPKNPFQNTVAAAGLVEPQTENIAIGSPESGVVVQVFVKVGQKVKTGEQLFRLDDRMLQAELRNRQVALLASQADLTRLENQPRPEQIPVSEAQVSEAEANLADQQDQLTRAKELATRNVVSSEELVRREQAFRVAQAQVARVHAEFDLLKAGAWKYDKEIAKAAVEQAAARVKQAEIELDRLAICALVDGEVLQVNVRPGEFVGAPASRALIVLGNVEQLHVRVDIDEHDIPRFIAGSPATAMVRGQPQVKYPLSYVSVEPYVIPKRSLTGDNTERVDTRVLQVIYAVDEQPKPLFVGQQLDVFIDVAPQAEVKAESGEPKAAGSL